MTALPDYGAPSTSGSNSPPGLAPSPSPTSKFKTHGAENLEWALHFFSEPPGLAPAHSHAHSRCVWAYRLAPASLVTAATARELTFEPVQAPPDVPGRRVWTDQHVLFHALAHCAGVDRAPRGPRDYAVRSVSGSGAGTGPVESEMRRTSRRRTTSTCSRKK